LLLHPSVPANTFSELVAYAKTKPGELNYGTFGIGTSGHPRRPPSPIYSEVTSR
jgi:tripartite-type tricarboxylate transporter receptor subunit TctC